ncbi:MAG TPA: peptidase M19, partial [Paraburkholderia sp.]|nr:peptidase M19 [Paraburkholderia sp.]
MSTDDASSATQSVWTAIRDDSALAPHASAVEIGGWMIPLDPAASAADYFLLTGDEPCSGGCVPRDPLRCIEVSARDPIELDGGALRLRGRLTRLIDDPAGWRYRLEAAERVSEPDRASSSVSSMGR